jgi:hypothetical protein
VGPRQTECLRLQESRVCGDGHHDAETLRFIYCEVRSDAKGTNPLAERSERSTRKRHHHGVGAGGAVLPLGWTSGLDLWVGLNIIKRPDAGLITNTRTYLHRPLGRSPTHESFETTRQSAIRVDAVG